MHEFDDWIRGKDIPPLIYKYARWIRNVDAWMQDYLFADKLHARAVQATIERTGRIGRKETLENYEVPAALWAKNKNYSYFDVGQEVFSNTVSALGITKIKCIGLSFKKNELFELADLSSTHSAALDDGTSQTISSSASTDDPPPNQIRSGNTIRKVDWEKFAAAFAAVASKDGLEVGVSAASIYRNIADLLAVVDHGGTHLSEDSVRDTITRAQEWQMKWPLGDE